MEKSLNTIRKLARLGKILSQIIFVLGIVLCVLCAVGAVVVALMKDLTIDGMPVGAYINDAVGLPGDTGLFTLVAALCLMAAQVVVARKAVKYFKGVLADGNPFTHKGADELKRLGLVALFLPLAVALVLGALSALIPGAELKDAEIYSGSSNGLFLLALVPFLRAGAHMREKLGALVDEK